MQKQRGEPGGPEENPGIREGFWKKPGPPLGGPESVFGGAGRRPEIGGQTRNANESEH
jgi:hypothetical protein